MNPTLQRLLSKIDKGWRPRPLPLAEDLRRRKIIGESLLDRGEMLHAARWVRTQL